MIELEGASQNKGEKHASIRRLEAALDRLEQAWHKSHQAQRDALSTQEESAKQWQERAGSWKEEARRLEAARVAAVHQTNNPAVQQIVTELDRCLGETITALKQVIEKNQTKDDQGDEPLPIMRTGS